MTVHPPGGAASAFESATVVTLILIALSAAIVIGAMIYGSRLARRRHQVEEIEEKRAEDYEKAHPEEAAPEPGPPPPEPVAEAAVPDPEPPVALAAPEVPEAETEAAKPEVSETETGPEAPPPAPSPPASPAPDDRPITTIKGLGPKVAGQLAELGVERIDQLAALTAGEAEAIDARLGAFTGRMKRDRWIEQAKLLVAGDTAAYEAQFGKLG